MRVLITGGDGDHGSLLGPELFRVGHAVIEIDTGYYREGTPYRVGGTIPQIRSKDVREIGVEDLRDFDAVVHMAELSNDPLGQLSHKITDQINHQSSVRLATTTNRAG